MSRKAGSLETFRLQCQNPSVISKHSSKWSQQQSIFHSCILYHFKESFILLNLQFF
jgi:hypothetical protein